MSQGQRPRVLTDLFSPLTVPFDGYVERPASVSSTCLVAVARNRYSVPCELAGQMVSTRLYPNEVVVVAGDAIVARHVRLPYAPRRARRSPAASRLIQPVSIVLGQD